jgi:hypothetical protein
LRIDKERFSYVPSGAPRKTAGRSTAEHLVKVGKLELEPEVIDLAVCSSPRTRH